MMPVDLKRLHKYMREVEHIGVSDERGEVVEGRYRPSTQGAAEEVAKLS